MEAEGTRLELRRAAAGADVTEIEDLEARFAADVEEPVIEGDPAVRLAGGHRSDQILTRDLEVARRVDRVGRERLSAEHEHLVG